MELAFYQAECGDAARLSFIGDDKKQHHIFVDSGYERTFKNIIWDDIEIIINNKETIDYWIVSHIHDDHIGGIKKYIEYIDSGELYDIVDDWIYNAPRFYLNAKGASTISQAKTIEQGDILYNYLHKINKTSLNDFTNDTGILNIAGLKIIFLGPTVYKLNALREKYEISKRKPLEIIEDEQISDAVGVVRDDYHIKFKDFDLDRWIEDVSIENGSSISFITEFKDRKILWLADSHPTDIVKSLDALGYSKNNKLTCEWVKVTHHGSRGNNSNELYDLIECTNYLFSATGENRSKLPTKESIARILRNHNRDFQKKYKLWFTYNNNALKRIFETDDQQIYSDFNFEVFFNYHKKMEFSL